MQLLYIYAKFLKADSNYLKISNKENIVIKLTPDADI